MYPATKSYLAKHWLMPATLTSIRVVCQSNIPGTGGPLKEYASSVG
jgi:hypothetical protein